MAQYQEQYLKLSFILGLHSSNILQYRLELGILQPIHKGASGKAILVFLSDDKINEVLEQEGVPTSDAQQIWIDMEKIRSVDYSYTFSERKNESVGIGTPIFDATNKVVGSIISAIPLSLYKVETKQITIDKILETAREIPYHLGRNETAESKEQ
ncbi:IclR family transcriptional regulator C-terminal domain-containing protein [Paenibacillus silvae]|nr:IclR family transcriptional regulator C-terminal domain-containing protein [Paenibacillus silvae]MDM5277436.1 IclR family transcriptional regulator C-terminal domain-containing protein [Paenibacillus silvae]